MSDRIDVTGDGCARPEDFRAALFDFGGTLGYDMPSYQDGFASILNGAGYPCDVSEYHRASAEAYADVPEPPRDRDGWLAWRPGYHRAIIRRLRVPAGDVDRVARLIAARLRYYTGVYPYPETHFVLGCLRDAGYRVGVISNIAPVLPDVLAETGIAPFLDFAVASDTFGCDKPDRRIFAEGLRLAECAARESIYVGDSVAADVVGCSALGMQPILIDRSGRAERTPGVLVVRNLTEILDWLRLDVWSRPDTRPRILSR